VVDYLARYTHRIAISNGRIEGIEGDHVKLRYKDYRDHARIKSLTLAGDEFVRRFLLHVLPKGQMRVRHFGFLANRCRAERLPRIREALAAPEPECEPATEGPREPVVAPCPHCGGGRLQVVAILLPARRLPYRADDVGDRTGSG